MSVKSIFSSPDRLPLLQGVLFFLILVTAYSALAPFFLSAANLANIITANTVIGLMAFGATFVIASGGIDLSTAAIMALSGVVAAAAAQTELSPVLVLFLSIIVGAGCGILNGALISFTRAPSFVVTLGTLSVYRAIAFIITDGTPIYGLPDFVTRFGQGALVGVPVPVLFLVFGFLLAALLLGYTRFGAHTLIFGDNVAAALANGISSNALMLRVYAIAGAFAGCAGFIFMARTNSGDPTAGQNYELLAITAVILGGANLFGGRAMMLGTLIGVLCLGVLQNGLNLMAVGTFYQILFVGLVLLLAALLRRTGER